MKIKPLEQRIHRIFKFLEQHAKPESGDPYGVLVDAYRGFIFARSTAVDVKAGDAGIYDVVDNDSFDAILTNQTVVDVDHAARARQQKAYDEDRRAGGIILGQPASRVSITKEFDRMYALIPVQLRTQVAKRL